MAFTSFYCRSGGSNLNGGALASNNEPLTTPVYTGVGDSDGTSVFTPSDGSTPASTVTVGDFASVYVTAGATVATFIGRVTVVAPGVNGAITVSTTAKSGTFPSASAGAHTITCNVGGAWLGPNAAVGFPFGFVTNALTNASGNLPRFNFKNDQTYSITSGITHSNANTWFEGYSSSAGDGGRATIDGSTNAIALLTNGANAITIGNFIFSNNGSTGTNAGCDWSGGSRGNVFRCVAHNITGDGFKGGTAMGIFQECEAYLCNSSNAIAHGGFNLSGGTALRCISHDNSGSNNNGFVIINGPLSLVRCIADTNGLHGFFDSGVSTLGAITNCDAYNNGGDGFLLTSASGGQIWIESCNAVKNTGIGIEVTAVSNGYILNCGFGSGTQVNGGGATSVGATASTVISGSITYASGVTPWVDPANGDFRINLAAAKGAGRGSFTETQASYAGTIGYPDIGSAQHKDSQRGHTFS